MLTDKCTSLFEDNEQIEARVKVNERRTSVEGKERVMKLDELTKELMASKTEVFVNGFISH
jgi:hypothetical protein